MNLETNSPVSNEAVVPAPKYRLAVVGRNLSSALALLSAHKRADLELTWYRAKYDAEYSHHPCWMLVPGSLIPDAFVNLPGVEKISAPLFFFNRRRRVSLNQLLKSVDDQSMMPKNSILRQKLAALGLWADLSPSTWQGGAPNVNWPYQLPAVSEIIKSTELFYLVEQRAWMTGLESYLASLGVQIDDPSSGVLGVELGHKTSHKLVLRSPHGFRDTDYILWTTTANSIIEEAKENHRSLRPLEDWQVAYRTQYAQVQAESVTALPPFSVWYDDQHPSYEAFMATGHYESGIIKQVITAPVPGKPELRYLEIRELMLKKNWQNKAFDHEERVDSLLWELCPLLKAATIEFQKTYNDESYFFGQPQPRHHFHGERIHYWNVGLLGQLPADALESIFPQIKIKNKKQDA